MIVYDFRLKFIIVATVWSFFYKGYKRYNYPTDCALKIESTQVSAENRVQLVSLIAFLRQFKRTMHLAERKSQQPKTFESHSNRLLVSMVRMRRRKWDGGERGEAGVNSRGPLLVPGCWFSWWDGLGDGLYRAPLPPPLTSQCMQYIPPTPDSFRPHHYRTIFTRLDSASLRLYSHTISICIFAVSVAGQLLWPWSTWFHGDNRQSLPPNTTHTSCHTGGREVSKYIIHVTELLPTRSWGVLNWI